MYITRRYSQDSDYYSGYPGEKYYGHGPTPELPGWDNADGEHAIPVHLFQKHVNELHLDQVITLIKQIISICHFIYMKNRLFNIVNMVKKTPL